ncbi:hypothetical protein PPD67_000672 [Proteus mirabilis]|nr:hypothetical protein [Proteus mirabilis]
MIEVDIKADLERITGLLAYPLKLPSDKLEGVIYQRIQIPDDYPKALMLEFKLCREWESVVHGYIGNYPIQTVQRGNFQQDMIEQTENRKIYRIYRDFIITYPEDAS